jgi:methionine-rich copper-binding protein CopC
MHLQARRFVALAVSAAVVALAPGRAMAHTELEFSLPANGTTVGEPVDEITVGFTDLVALVGNGFEVHDPQGNLLTPFVVTDDNEVFKFQLDPPLAGGVVTVDYHVRALDGDVQEGSFSFTVAAPLASSTTSTSTGASTAIEPGTTIVSNAPATTDLATVDVTTTDATTTDATTTDARTTDATISVSAAAGAEPATTPPATAAASTLPSDGSDDNERTLMFVVLLGIAAASAGFLVLRSRRPA